MLQRTMTSTSPDVLIGLSVIPSSRSTRARRASRWSGRRPHGPAIRLTESGPSPTTITSRLRRSFSGSFGASPFQTVESALKSKDPYTWGHCKRVGAFASGIARCLGLTGDRIVHIRIAGEFHDVGKIGVPERLLRKRGPLTANEYRQVMAHPAVGERILRLLLPDGHPILGAVRSHHERYDGHGGPDGLASEEIPMGARIVAVADAFDAMTSTRPYRPRLKLDTALKELEENAGSQFDPECVRALQQLYPDHSPVEPSQVAVPA